MNGRKFGKGQRFAEYALESATRGLLVMIPVTSQKYGEVFVRKHLPGWFIVSSPRAGSFSWPVAGAEDRGVSFYITNRIEGKTYSEMTKQENGELVSYFEMGRHESDL